VQGAALASEIDAMNPSTPGYRVSRTGPKDAAGFITHLRETAQTDGGSAANQIRQRQAILNLDLPAELGISVEEAAGRVRAKMMVIVLPRDYSVNPEPAKRFARAAGAPVVELDSECGHLSISCISIGPIVAQFLNNPSSIPSPIMYEPASR
jgi:homoserine O-acetyltransferase